MPVCVVCGQRIDLTKKYERVHRCSKCGKAVCRAHYREEKEICLICAGEEFLPRRRSFVRRG
ncbi:MAG: hypothetical protein ACE5KV_00300 [Thermoplasmata archaeon]